jgi:cysteine desulfurase
VAGLLNISFRGVEGESLQFALRELAVSAGSACSSASEEASYVLRALGRSDRLAQSSLRLSLGRFTTAEDVDHAAARIEREIRRLRAGEPSPDAPAGFGGDPRYSPEVQRRVGSLPGWSAPDRGVPVAVGRAGDREQGAEVEVTLRVEHDRIAAARFQAFGCPHLLAAASWAVEQLEGRNRSQAERWDWQEAVAALQVPPAKFGRLLTLQDAIRAAARNWPTSAESTV